MYELNGYMYAGTIAPMLEAIWVEARPDHVLLVQFNDGAIRSYDVKPILHLPVFQPLQDEAVFNQVDLVFGAPTWQNGEIDIDPETIYAKGVPLTTWPKSA